MEYYLVDVKSMITIDGKEVAFDYINTYCDLNIAIGFAKYLSENKDVLDVAVHKWILETDGTERIINEIPYWYSNKNHREFKEGKLT